MKRLLLEVILSLIVFAPFVCGAEINEIMYNPIGNDYDFEFLELWFDAETDVTGWYFEGVNFEFGEEIVEGYVIVANTCFEEGDDNDFIDRYGISCEYEYSGTLKNEGELIVLYDSEGNIIDSVEYSPEWGANSRGSLEKQSEGNWIESEDDYGSAGEKNSEGVVEDEEDEDIDDADEEDGEDNEDESPEDELDDYEETYIPPDPILIEIAGTAGYGDGFSEPINDESSDDFDDEKSDKIGLYLLGVLIIGVLVFFLLRKS